MGKIDRRLFLWIAVMGAFSLPLFRWLWKRKERKHSSNIPGQIKSPSFRYGHLLWTLPFKKPLQDSPYDYVIIGSGISALSAARTLKQKGINNFKILELEAEAGGNSRNGENPYGKYPLGAHYLPIPSRNMKELISFLKETGVIEREAPSGDLYYNEDYLCHAPQERLYIHGHWQSGTVPDFGLPDHDKKEIKRFFEYTESLKFTKGSDGKFLFDFPLLCSSEDKAWRALDQMSMKEYLHQNHYSSEFLFWYVDYCCKDDYGTGIEEVSAWAALHYFCARRADAANAPAHHVLTWPEGNGWLMNRLRQNLNDQLQPNAMVYGLTEDSNGLSVSYFHTTTQKTHRIACKKVIVCCPQFVIKHFQTNIDGLKTRPYEAFQYSSWMVGTLAVKNNLYEKGGSNLCWDNVIYNGKSLGYVNSSHQHLNIQHPVLNLTYYHLLNKNEFSRKKLLHATHRELSDLMLQDMLHVYPDMKDSILNYEPFVWGHAMIKPLKGFIWGEARQKAMQPINDKIYFAHTDLSGISTFEEGFYQGISAVTQMLQDS